MTVPVFVLHITIDNLIARYALDAANHDALFHYIRTNNLADVDQIDWEEGQTPMQNIMWFTSTDSTGMMIHEDQVGEDRAW